jgi:hypothetical protein
MVDDRIVPLTIFKNNDYSEATIPVIIKQKINARKRVTRQNKNLTSTELNQKIELLGKELKMHYNPKNLKQSERP